MLLSEIISQNLVVSFTNISSKKRLFQEIANNMAIDCSLSIETILTALQNREQLGPTGMGNGIAIPHARVENIPNIKGMFIRLEKPINFDSMDKQKVDIIFAILAPIDFMRSLPWLCLLIHEVFQKAKPIAKSPDSIINKRLLFILSIISYSPFL